MDPSDSVYDEFYPQAREIQRASLIVASLLSKNHRDWEQHNAHVALLIGFAIGMGKQVLVLQETPLTPILDLGSVARPLASEGEAEEIVKSWLNMHARSVIWQREEARKQAAKREKTNLIRNVYLGHPDALQDSRLLEYFVPTKEFEDAVEGRRTIYFGRRGSGKSANFQAIKADLSKKPNTVLVEIAPDDFELERIGTFLEREYDLVNAKLVFQHVWHYIICSEILKTIDEDTDRLYSVPNSAVRRGLRQHIENNHKLLDIDFGSRVITVLNDVVAGSFEQTVDQRQRGAEEAIKSLRDYDLARQLKEFGQEDRVTFFVIADDLDKHWRPGTQQSIDLLIGLISEVARLQRYFGDLLKIVLFLREDIYEILAQHDDDLSKRNFIRMDWTKNNLKHLVAERLSIGAGQINEDDDVTWSAIFPDAVDGTAAPDYILSRCLPRPRDVLDLCQKAIDQAQRNGHTSVAAQDILDGERSVSDGMFKSLSTEFRSIYPELDLVLLELAGVERMFSWHDFSVIASKAIRSNEDVFKKWLIGGEIDPLRLADVFFTIGVIGFSRQLSSEPFFCNGRSFTETWGLVSPEPIVHIHPAFKTVLDVSDVMSSGTRRVRRRNRRDPRQLAFSDEA